MTAENEKVEIEKKINTPDSLPDKVRGLFKKAKDRNVLTVVIVAFLFLFLALFILVYRSFLGSQSEEYLEARSRVKRDVVVLDNVTALETTWSLSGGAKEITVEAVAETFREAEEELKGSRCWSVGREYKDECRLLTKTVEDIRKNAEKAEEIYDRGEQGEKEEELEELRKEISEDLEMIVTLLD